MGRVILIVAGLLLAGAGLALLVIPSGPSLEDVEWIEVTARVDRFEQPRNSRGRLARHWRLFLSYEVDGRTVQSTLTTEPFAITPPPTLEVRYASTLPQRVIRKGAPIPPDRPLQRTISIAALIAIGGLISAMGISKRRT